MSGTRDREVMSEQTAYPKALGLAVKHRRFDVADETTALHVVQK
jgi:hypothetical protein